MFDKCQLGGLAALDSSDPFRWGWMHYHSLRSENVFTGLSHLKVKCVVFFKVTILSSMVVYCA